MTKDWDVDLIRWIWAFIDWPLDRFEQAATFWTTVTDSGLSARRGSTHEFATLPSRSGQPALKLQGVHCPGGAHLDLEVDDVPAAIVQACGLGATVVASKPVSAVMQSPGGQQFYVEPWDGAASQPPVVEHPDGSVSRLDQVCLDIAQAGYEVKGRSGPRRPGASCTPARGRSLICSNRLQACRSVSCCSVSTSLDPPPPTSIWPVRTLRQPVYGTNNAAPVSSPAGRIGSS